MREVPWGDTDVSITPIQISTQAGHIDIIDMTAPLNRQIRIIMQIMLLPQSQSEMIMITWNP